jgi:hypothetical protein
MHGWIIVTEIGNWDTAPRHPFGSVFQNCTKCTNHFEKWLLKKFSSFVVAFNLKFSIFFFKIALQQTIPKNFCVVFALLWLIIIIVIIMFTILCIFMSRSFFNFCKTRKQQPEKRKKVFIINNFTGSRNFFLSTSVLVCVCVMLHCAQTNIIMW